MNAPDKIYIQQDMINNLILEKQEFDNDVEYIRKDALLEWAEEMKDAWECYSDISYYQEFIDKINSI